MTLPFALSLVAILIAGAHGWWATGRIWPAASEAALARAVIGDGRVRMPPPWQCAAVTIALAFVAAWPWVIVAWPHPALTAAHERLGGELALPMAVALAAAAHGIALEATLGGYLHAFTANLISAAVRTVPLGQSDGQLALAALEGAVRRTAEAALAVETLDEVGTATPLLDWCSLSHETQYTRLFRS